MSREYGKLSEDQFRRVIRKLPDLRREGADFRAHLEKMSDEKLRSLIGDGLCWAPLYERTFQECLALLVYVLGDWERIKQIAQLPDPQEALLQAVDGDDDLDWNGGPGGVFNKGEPRDWLLVYARTLGGVITR